MKSDKFVEGSTPLHLACKKSNVTCVNFLLHMNVPVDVKDARGLTPLDVIGAYDDELDIPAATVKVSVDSIMAEESGAQSPESITSYDSISFKTPKKLSRLISTSSKTVHPPIIEGIVSRPTSSTLGFTEGNLKKSCVTSIAKSLLEKGAKMPTTLYREGYARNQSKAQMTALHTAVEDDNVELVKILLERDGCMLSWNNRGETALHMAIKNRFIEPLKAMLTYRNPSEIIDVRDSQGKTLLHLAVMTEWMDGVSLLLEHGADVKTSSNQKENVLHLAAGNGNFKMLEELLSVIGSEKVLPKLFIFMPFRTSSHF